MTGPANSRANGDRGGRGEGVRRSSDRAHPKSGEAGRRFRFSNAALFVRTPALHLARCQTGRAPLRMRPSSAPPSAGWIHRRPGRVRGPDADTRVREPASIPRYRLAAREKYPHGLFAVARWDVRQGRRGFRHTGNLRRSQSDPLFSSIHRARYAKVPNVIRRATKHVPEIWTD